MVDQAINIQALTSFSRANVLCFPTEEQGGDKNVKT